jgi:hypothetical protein
MGKERWKRMEVAALVSLYPNFTTKELAQVFHGKNEESINSKIRRLKEAGVITQNRTQETIVRASFQRRKENPFYTRRTRSWPEPRMNALKLLYKDFTTKELHVIFSRPTVKQINDKIRFLKDSGEIVGNRSPETASRAMKQRRWSKQIARGVWNVAPDSWMDEE